MGVTGLLPFAKAAIEPSDLSKLKKDGVKTVVADAYCWLHRAAAAAATPANLPSQSDAHVRYCLKYVNLILSYNIKPILVFDGRHLPAKALTEDKRRESRKQAKKRAVELMAIGKLEEAKSHLRRSIDITHEMALELIKECRKINVDCIVAPYEADAQLAYLNKSGIADVVITEDSDLILFGCTKVLFKMDTNGNGMLFDSSKLHLVMKCPLERYSFNKFRQMCILSGCDYISSLPGIGLVKARQFINATQDPDISNALKRLPSFFSGLSLQMTDDYREMFMKAEATFKHQLVYDPVKRKMVPLTPLKEEGSDRKFCSNAGEYLNADIAFQIAIGNMDPFTLNKLDDWDPDTFKPIQSKGKSNGWSQPKIAPHASVWNKDYFTLTDKNDTKIIRQFETAIVTPESRKIKSKIVDLSTKENDLEELSISDLKNMYSIKTPKRKRGESPDALNFSDGDKIKLENAGNSSFTTKISELTVNDVDNQETSPVLLKKNRTYKKMKENCTQLKKFSKFQRTIVDENVLVHSKFFESYTPEYTPKETDTESKTTDTSFCDALETDFISVRRDVYIDELSEVTEIDAHKTGTVINNRKFASENIYRIDENTDCAEVIKYCSGSETACISSIIESNILNTNDTVRKADGVIVPVYSKDDTEDKSKESNNYIVKKHLPQKNTCRQPGLRKNKSSSSLPQGQLTLSGFGFQKKSQLKH